MRAREAWEVPFYLTIGGVAAVFFAFQFRPSTNPHDWSRDEAEERFRRCAAAGSGRGLPPWPWPALSHTHPHPPRAPHTHAHRVEAGLPVVRGVNYAGLRFMKESGSLTEEQAAALEEGADTQTKMPQVLSQAAHP